MKLNNLLSIFIAVIACNSLIADDAISTSEPNNLEVNINDKPENIFWAEVKASPSKAMYMAYLEQYPVGHYALIAKIKISEYEEKEIPLVSTPSKANGMDDSVRNEGYLKNIKTESNSNPSHQVLFIKVTTKYRGSEKIRKVLVQNIYNYLSVDEGYPDVRIIDDSRSRNIGILIDVDIIKITKGITRLLEISYSITDNKTKRELDSSVLMSQSLIAGWNKNSRKISADLSHSLHYALTKHR